MVQDELFPTLSSTVLKTGTLTDLHVSKYKKIARQEFTSSDIADDNPQTLYSQNVIFFEPGPQEITSSSIKGIS